jgi:hypothetical protein
MVPGEEMEQEEQEHTKIPIRMLSSSVEMKHRGRIAGLLIINESII